MSKEIEILPSSYTANTSSQTPQDGRYHGTRLVTGRVGNSFYSRQPSYNVQPSQNFVQRRNLPTSSSLHDYQPQVLRSGNAFTRTQNYYDGAPRQAYNSHSSNANSGARVVMVRSGNSGVKTTNYNFNRPRVVGGNGSNLVPRSVIRVDSAGNKYVQLPNGQLSQVRARLYPQQPLPMSHAIQQRRYLTPGSISNRRNMTSQYALEEAEEREINKAIVLQEKLMRRDDERRDFRKDSELSRYVPPYDRRGYLRINRLQDKNRTVGFQNNGLRFVGLGREHSSGFVSYASNADDISYRTIMQPQNYSSTTFVPVSAMESSLLLSSATQINLSDSEDTKVCKSILQDIIDEICFTEESVINSHISNQSSLLLNSGRFLPTGHVHSRFQKNRHSLLNLQPPQLNETLRRKQVPEHGIYVGASLISHSAPRHVTEDELNKFVEHFKKEINKRRLILEQRAEEEIGIQTPWRRTRTKSVKPFKKQVQKKENAPVTLELCDPRYITLGGNSVPDKDIPLKMELDLSGNAKITTASEMMDELDAALNDSSSGGDQLADKNINTSFSKARGDFDNESDDSLNKSKKPKYDTGSHQRSVLRGKPKRNSAKSQRRVASFASLQPNSLRQCRSASNSGGENAEDEHSDEADVEARHLADLINNVGTSSHSKRSKAKNYSSKKSNANTASNKHQQSSSKLSSLVNKKQLKNQDADGKAISKYCPCGGSYDSKKFYISCNVCSRWYHGKCVNITEKKAQKLVEEGTANGGGGSGWMCTDCEKQRNQSSAEVYCVCRRPYDDTKFYVGCDSCEDWFHPECIGTTQAEASKCDTFLCPKCRESDI